MEPRPEICGLDIALKMRAMGERMNLNLLRAAACLGILTGPVVAQAADIGVAIKSGETIPINRHTWLDDCKGLLKSPPKAEILFGPDNLTVTITKANMVPSGKNCTKEVLVGLLSLTAKEIKEVSNAKLIVRITYDTEDGERSRGYTYDVAMVP
jgi:hypothetical protein